MTVNVYETDYLLSLAYAAYRKNGDYIKETKLSEDPEKTVWCNKELVAYTVAAHKSEKWIPKSFKPITVSEEDTENAKRAREYVKRYTLKLLSGKINGFQKDVFDTISSDTVPSTKLALVCYVPKMIEREVAEDQTKKKIRNDYRESVHIALESTLSGSATIFKKIYLKDHDITLYTGGIDGNLVAFTSKLDLSIGSCYDISARAKKHQFCIDTGYPQTKISYVKLKSNGKASKTKKKTV